MGLGTAAASAGMFAGAPITADWIDGLGRVYLFPGVSFVLILPLLIFVARVSETLRAVAWQTIHGALSKSPFQSVLHLVILRLFRLWISRSVYSNPLPAYIIDEGLTPIIGAWSLALIGLFNIAGSFLWAGRDRFTQTKTPLWYLSDTRNRQHPIYHGPTNGHERSVLFGGYGDFVAVHRTANHGINRADPVAVFSTLVGLVFFSHRVGGFLGAWLGGKLYDTTGGYQAMWVAAIVLGLIATVLHLPIRDTPGALAKQRHHNLRFGMVPPPRLEQGTSGSTIQRSNQLS